MRQQYRNTSEELGDFLKSEFTSLDDFRGAMRPTEATLQPKPTMESQQINPSQQPATTSQPTQGLMRPPAAPQESTPQPSASIYDIPEQARPYPTAVDRSGKPQGNFDLGTPSGAIMFARFRGMDDSQIAESMGVQPEELDQMVQEDIQRIAQQTQDTLTPQTFSEALALKKFEAEQAKEPEEKPKSVDEKKAESFYNRMSESEKTLKEFEELGGGLGGLVFGPEGGGFQNLLKSSDRQQFEQAQRDFINAQLRRESGAVISPEEFENAAKQYFPQPGDSPETIAQKRRNREIVVENMAREGRVTPPEGTSPEGEENTGGQPFTGPDGQQYVFID
jgi:hypothetical protein